MAVFRRIIDQGTSMRYSKYLKDYFVNLTTQIFKDRFISYLLIGHSSSVTLAVVLQVT